MPFKNENNSDDLIFSQRFGYKPIPKPMQLEEISSDLRREIGNRIWRLLSESSSRGVYGPYLSGEMKRFVERVLGKITRKYESEISINYYKVTSIFQSIIKSGKFHDVIDLLEIMIEELSNSDKFANDIKELFRDHQAAYWLDTSGKPFRFFPSASKHQGDAIRQAIESIHDAGLDGAATHLRQAAEHINLKQFADSIADSIHAVESVAKMINPASKKTLGPALNSLERAGVLKNKDLKKALENLYHYTNTSQGIRHALSDKNTADVELADAIFMFGACASFSAYLSSLHQLAKEHQ